MNSFQDFYTSLGFQEYPFASFSAEHERKRIQDLFVRPAVYAPLVEIFGNRASVIVSGERGTGKTALTYELMRKTNSESLVVYIDNFANLTKGYVANDLYKFFLDQLAEELFRRLASRPWALWTKSRDDKLLLSYLLKFHVGQLSIARIEERIRNTQSNSH